MKTFCDILFDLPKKHYAMVHINGEYNAPVNNSDLRIGIPDKRRIY